MIRSTGLMAAGLVLAAGIAACAGTGDDTGAPAGEAASSGDNSGGAGGSKSAGGSGEGGSGGSGGGPSGSGGGLACGPSDGIVLAMDELFLGDVDFGHVKKSDAWMDFGFDLDGQSTIDDFSDHCQPYTGATTSIFEDGDDGLDNSFGRNLLPSLLSYQPTLPQTANDTIASGQFTMITFFEGLGAEPSVDPLVTKLYSGAPLLAPPLWDGSDCWPVTFESVTDHNDVNSATISFDTSALDDDRWESGSTATVVLPLNFAGYIAPVTVHNARLAMTLNPTHSGAALGVLAGVLDREEFLETVRDAFGNLDPSWCTGGIFANLEEDIRRSSDIMKDGSQDPGAICDGISVGLGFTMLQIERDGVAEPSQQNVDPCP